MFSYTVRCQIDDPKVAQSWLDWLVREHVQDVITAGAEAAEIFQMDQSTFEIRYRFKSRQSFEHYEQNHAPHLRAQGLAKFPLELGLEYSRSTGRCLHRFNC